LQLIHRNENFLKFIAQVNNIATVFIQVAKYRNGYIVEFRESRLTNSAPFLFFLKRLNFLQIHVNLLG